MRAIGLLVLILAPLACVPRLDDCASDDDCAAGRACSGGYCLPPDAGLDGASEPEPSPVDGAPIDAEPIDRGPPEACNRFDDDGDGVIDEAVPPLACEVGVGACRRTGESRCVDGAMVCGAIPGDAAAEQCNGIDDDCDGAADEAGVEGLCCPTPEQCNGVDDDCDGYVDDLLPLTTLQTIDQHPPGGPYALDVAAGPLRTVILTASEGASRPVAHVYQRGALQAVDAVVGMDLDPRITTRIVAANGRFVVVAAEPVAGELTGLAALRFDFSRERPLTDRTSAVQGGVVDQLELTTGDEGAVVIYTHAEGAEAVEQRALLVGFMMPAAGLAYAATGYAHDGGFAAALDRGFTDLVWQTTEGLDSLTYHPLEPRQDPEVRIAGGARPILFGLDDDAILAWHTRDPEASRLGARTFRSGRQIFVDGATAERPTGVAIGPGRFALGWRRDGEGIVGLFEVWANTLRQVGEHALGPADRPPALGARDGLLTVAWLRASAVQVQHFDANAQCAERR